MRTHSKNVSNFLLLLLRTIEMLNSKLLGFVCNETEFTPPSFVVLYCVWVMCVCACVFVCVSAQAQPSYKEHSVSF